MMFKCDIFKNRIILPQRKASSPVLAHELIATINVYLDNEKPDKYITTECLIAKRLLEEFINGSDFSPLNDGESLRNNMIHDLEILFEEYDLEQF